MRARPAHSEFRIGFTLIELMVVVAIIAILVAITVPALSTVRENGRLAYCGNNLGQMGKALSMFADANDDRLPQWDSTADAASWAVRIAEYQGGDTNVFICPSDPFTPLAGRDRSYAANANGAVNASYSFPFGQGHNQPGYGPLRMGELDAHSGDIILVSEWIGNPTYSGGGTRGRMDNDFFASLDLHPATAHRGGAGGNYLMGSMGVRYIKTADAKTPPEGNPGNLWVVVPP